jgi:hypothetical protein
MNGIELGSLDHEESPHLYRLSCQWVHRTSSSHLKLVEYHMPQPLIIDHSKVDVGSKLLACYARVHWFVTIVVVSSSTKLPAEVIYGSVRLGEPIDMT